jgi:predicted DNA binding CopG/RHH family protein
MKRKSTIVIDDDIPITQADIDDGRLILRKRVAGRVVQPKKRVTLYLDVSLVEHFKELAGSRGYQTLINETLKKAIQQVSIETAIRQTIRDELDGRTLA